MAATQFTAPVGLLEHLVYEQHLAAALPELACEVGKATALEVEVVHVDVEASARLHVEMLLGVLKQKARLANTSCAFDAYQRLLPVHLVHEGAAHEQVGVFHQIGVCAEESLH